MIQAILLYTNIIYYYYLKGWIYSKNFCSMMLTGSFVLFELTIGSDNNVFIGH